MADVFVGSHEKPFTGGSTKGYGQNGDASASSLLPGQAKPAIGADVAPKQTSVPGLDPQDTLEHRVKMDGDKAASLPTHSSMTNRTPGSPSGVMDGKGNSHAPKR
jgi:hypothetical protein